LVFLHGFACLKKDGRVEADDNAAFPMPLFFVFWWKTACWYYNGLFANEKKPAGRSLQRMGVTLCNWFPIFWVKHFHIAYPCHIKS